MDGNFNFLQVNSREINSDIGARKVYKMNRATIFCIFA